MSEVINFEQGRELAAPDLSEVMAYRGVHVLGTMRYADGRGRLTASHYASCLIFGQNPMWGVWTAGGKFLRFYGSRAQIENAYPRLVWRRRMASWRLLTVDDREPQARALHLSDHYHAELPEGRREAKG